MSWHQTHVKQINTFLHTLTSVAISLWAQLALHHGNSFGTGCYCRRTTLNQQHLFDSAVFTPVCMVAFCTFLSNSKFYPGMKWAATQHTALNSCVSPCHTFMELSAVGDHHSIWAVITTCCGVNYRWVQSEYFFPFHCMVVLAYNRINNPWYIIYKRPAFWDTKCYLEVPKWYL